MCIRDSSQLTAQIENSFDPLQLGIFANLLEQLLPARLISVEGYQLPVSYTHLRPVVFDHTMLRVSDAFQTRMHIDYDEANACGYTPGTLAMIMKDRG